MLPHKDDDYGAGRDRKHAIYDRKKIKYAARVSQLGRGGEGKENATRAIENTSVGRTILTFYASLGPWDGYAFFGGASVIVFARAVRYNVGRYARPFLRFHFRSSLCFFFALRNVRPPRPTPRWSDGCRAPKPIGEPVKVTGDPFVFPSSSHTPANRRVPFAVLVTTVRRRFHETFGKTVFFFCFYFGVRP